MSSSQHNDPVSGGSRLPETVLVWDLAIRVFHWALVASILAAYLTSDGLGRVHRLAGYTAVGLLVFRIVWGFTGTRHARFTDFVRSPATVLGYIRDILRGHATRSLGHNPAGGAMILALLAIVAGIGTTGVMMESTRFFGVDWVETVHKSLVYSLFVLVPLHVLGVILASRSHRENLAASMITGRKPMQGTDGEADARGRELETRLRATNGLALAAIVTILVTLGWPQVRAQLDVLEKRRAVAATATTKAQTSTSIETTANTIKTTSATATASAPVVAESPTASAKSETSPGTAASAPSDTATPVADGRIIATASADGATAAQLDAQAQTDPGPALATVTQHTLREIAATAHPRAAFETAMVSSEVLAPVSDEPRAVNSRPAASKMPKAKTALSTARRAPSARKATKSAALAPQQHRAVKRAPISTKPAATITRKATRPTVKTHPAPKAIAAVQTKKSGKGRGRGRSGSSGKGRSGSSGKGSGNSGKGSGNSGKGSSGSSGKGSGGGGSSGSGGGHGSSGGGGD